MMEATPPEINKKRPRGSPTGSTPQQSGKRSQGQAGLRAKRSLELSFTSQRNPSLSQYVPASEWSAEEVAALVEFVVMYHEDRWPTFKHDKFWTSAATFVHQRAGTPHLRTGMYIS